MEVKLLLYLLTIFSSSILFGCATIPPDPPTSTNESLYQKLETVVLPEKKVPIAVYSFTDMTGQRKPGEAKKYRRDTVKSTVGGSTRCHSNRPKNQGPPGTGKAVWVYPSYTLSPA